MNTTSATPVARRSRSRPWIWLLAMLPIGLMTFGASLMVAAISLPVADLLLPGGRTEPAAAGVAFGVHVAAWALVTAGALVLLARALIDRTARPDRIALTLFGIAIAIASPLMGALVVWFRGRGLDVDQVGATVALPYAVVVAGLGVLALRLRAGGLPAAFRLIHLVLVGLVLAIVALAVPGALDGIEPDSLGLAVLVGAAAVFALIAGVAAFVGYTPGAVPEVLGR